MSNQLGLSVALAQIAASREDGKQRQSKGGTKKGQVIEEQRLGLVAVKQRWQLTLTEALQALNISIGDYLEVVVKDGRITLVPVAVIPRDEMYLMSPGWQRQLEEAKADAKAGRVHHASSVEDLLADLEEESEADE